MAGPDRAGFWFSWRGGWMVDVDLRLRWRLRVEEEGGGKMKKK